MTWDPCSAHGNHGRRSILWVNLAARGSAENHIKPSAFCVSIRIRRNKRIGAFSCLRSRRAGVWGPQHRKCFATCSRRIMTFLKCFAKCFAAWCRGMIAFEHQAKCFKNPGLARNPAKPSNEMLFGMLWAPKHEALPKGDLNASHSVKHFGKS